MPETEKTPAVAPADPNKSETAQIEKAAAALIVDDLKQSEAGTKAAAPTDKKPEPPKAAPAAQAPRQHNTPNRPAPRQVMHVKSARGTTTHLPPPNRRRERYVDPSVPRVTVEQRRGADDYSNPYFKITTTLSSDPAQRYFEHNFQRIDRSVMVISLVCAAIGGQELAQRRTAEAEAKSRGLEKELIDTIENLKKTMTDRGIPEAAQVPAYDHKRDYTAAVHTPQSSQFITLVNLFDRLVARVDAARFHMIFTADQQRTMINSWYRRLNDYVTQILELRQSALQEAREKGRQQDAKAIEQRVERETQTAEEKKNTKKAAETAKSEASAKPAAKPAESSVPTAQTTEADKAAPAKAETEKPAERK